MSMMKWMMAGGLAVTLLSGAASAQVIGGDTTIDGSRDDVAFLGGELTVRGDIQGSVSGIAGEANIDANVTGDIEFFGGDATVRGSVGGEIDIAGGSISIRADVEEDVNAAGGSVEVAGRIGGELNTAGGSVELDVIVQDESNIGGGYVLLAPSSEFYGPVDIVAGEIEFLGTANAAVDVEAETFIIGGTVNGDVEVIAERVQVLASAVITGEMRVRGPYEPELEEGATIGTLDYTYEKYNFGAEDWDNFDVHIEGPWQLIGAPFEFLGGIFLGVAFFLGVMASLIAPRGVTGVTRTFRRRPVSSFFVGIVAFPVSLILMVVLTIVLAISIIGIPLIFLIWPLYPWLLFLGFALGGVIIGDLLFNRNQPNKGLGLAMRALSLLVVMVALAVLGQIEGLGFLVAWFIWIFGMGAWVLSIGDRHRRDEDEETSDDDAEDTPKKRDPEPETDNADSGDTVTDS